MAPADSFDPADNRSRVIVTVVSTLVPLASVIVALRLYTRHFLGNGLCLDDWMSGWSMVCATDSYCYYYGHRGQLQRSEADLKLKIMVIITGAVMILEAQSGLGTHRVFLSDEEYMQYNKVSQVPGGCALPASLS